MKTSKLIKEMEENFIRMTPLQKREIIEYWGENISSIFTEQDIAEQTRRVMQNVEKLKE